jgi:phage tail protein X
MSSIYIVKQGESIWDVTQNSTGTLGSTTVNNLDLILEANGFTDWTPVLTAGQAITIPDGVIFDLNAQRQLAIYPSVNNLSNFILNLIETLFAALEGLWILTTTFWNDNAPWKDNKVWTD